MPLRGIHYRGVNCRASACLLERLPLLWLTQKQQQINFVCVQPAFEEFPFLKHLLVFAARWCWLGVWLHCSGRVLVCSFLCSFCLLFRNLPGFFSLTSIAYRRVIRVYQYEVGDDLSGRFFPLIFLPHVGFQTHSLIPRLAFLPTNFHGLEMLGGLFPSWLSPWVVPSFLLRVLGVRFISLDVHWTWA